MFLDILSQSYSLLLRLLSKSCPYQKRVALCFLFILIFFADNAIAQVGLDQKYFLVEDLQQEWLVYDRYRKNYVPFVAEEHSNHLSIHTLIDLANNRHYKILLSIDSDAHLFVNGSLKQKIDKGEWQIFDIDSLYRIYQKPQILLSLYGSVAQSKKELLIVYPKAGTVEKLIAVEEESFLQIKPRNRSLLDNFFVLGLIFIIGFTASLFTSYPRIFQKLYSFYDMLRVRIKDDSFLINKPLSRSTLLFVGLLSFQLAYVVIFIETNAPQIIDTALVLSTNPTWLNTWWSYMGLAAIIFIGFILKYFMSYTFGTLFNLEKVVNLHFYKSIQASIIFYSLLITALSVASIYIIDWVKWSNSLLIIPIIIFYTFRVVLLFLTIRSSLPVKNLYLISYLCVIELIPMIVGIRYAL